MTLGYDPALRLYQVAGATTTRFAYDGLNAIAEYNASNALQRRFVFGPGIDEAIVQYEGTGTTDRRFMSADERGSIISLTNTSGTLLGINRYDEYGKPQSTNIGRFQYTGQKWIGEANLYDYKFRMYAAHLGIFVQPDPIGYAGDGPNLYAYVLNDPVNFVDPLGLECSGLGYTSFDPQNPSGPLTIVCFPNRSGVSAQGGLFAPLASKETPRSVLWKIIDVGQIAICGLLSELPEGTSLSVSVDAQAYGGIGGYLGVSAFVDKSGNTGVNFTRGWGAGFGGVGGVGLTLGKTPAPGRTAVGQLQGGVGIGYAGASASYSKAQGWGGSGGVSLGPRLGYAAGSVYGVSSTIAGRNICK